MVTLSFSLSLSRLKAVFARGCSSSSNPMVPNQSVGRKCWWRRGAAFLGAALVTGAFLDAHPKETAKLCKRLKACVGDADEVVEGHCVRAMEALDALLGERLKAPDDSGASDLHRMLRLDEPK